MTKLHRARARVPRQRPRHYLSSIIPLKTPTGTFDKHFQNDCVPYADWSPPEHAGEVAASHDIHRRDQPKKKVKTCRRTLVAPLSTALVAPPVARASLLLPPQLAWFLLVYHSRRCVVLLVTHSGALTQPVHTHRPDMDAVDFPP